VLAGRASELADPDGGGAPFANRWGGVASSGHVEYANRLVWPDLAVGVPGSQKSLAMACQFRQGARRARGSWRGSRC